MFLTAAARNKAATMSPTAFFPRIIVAFAGVALTALGLVVILNSQSAAQDPQLQEKVAALKQAAAANKQAMAQYTWIQQETVAIKGQVKKQEFFQVRIGPDGKPQKTQVGAAAQPQSESGRKRGLKQAIKEKKLGEFEDYAKSLSALAQQYAQPDPERLQAAAQAGNVQAGPAGAPNAVQLVVQNYVKPGDKVTYVFDPAQKTIKSFDVASYLKDPGDKATISVRFAQVPSGPTHVSLVTVNGVSKQLTITMQNSEYRKL